MYKISELQDLNFQIDIQLKTLKTKNFKHESQISILQDLKFTQVLFHQILSLQHIKLEPI